MAQASEKVTLRIVERPQWLAIAWVREAGEVRPALDVLRSDDEVSAELRAVLAEWIAKGSKRKRGAIVPRDPWREFPPKLAASLSIATTPLQKRVWMFFVVGVEGIRMLGAAGVALSTGRGRPLTAEGAAIKQAAKKFDIHERTAREWFWRFFPDGFK